MTPTLFAAITIVSTSIFVWQAVRSWRAFAHAKGKPVLHLVTPEQVESLPLVWPNRSWRWPIPRPPELAADAVLAASYAHHAKKMERNLRRAADLLALVAGSWLGLTLPSIWRQAVDAGASGPSAVYSDPRWWQAIAPVLVLALSAGLALLAEDSYAELHGAYERAAVRLPPANRGVTTLQQDLANVDASARAPDWRARLALWLLRDRPRH